MLIFKDHDEEAGDSFEGGNPENYPFPLYSYCFYEVNYGNLPFLDALMQAGIPFDSDWDSGGEYGAGVETCRFTPDGQAIRKETANEYRNPEISKLMGLLDKPDELKACIVEHFNHVTSLPWDNQIEYAKIYRLTRIITPKED